jgi:hypothetical protein
MDANAPQCCVCAHVVYLVHASKLRPEFDRQLCSKRKGKFASTPVYAMKACEHTVPLTPNLLKLSGNFTYDQI